MPIGSVSNVGHGQVDNIKGDNVLKKNEGVKAVSAVVQEGHGLGGIVDKVELSSEVEGLQNMLSMLKADLEKVPEVRPGKVDEAKKRMESGYYDRPEVITKVAGEIRKLTI
ncbi:MAG: flagellar biosynthesis anti-sigma factor FlgM [Planctomycetes bacterium]|nr:flagellar biosynthesis anti-sigma factor FlgM [Planctomycetota bacterium]